MPDLPETRATPSRAFQYVGVDYLGPILVQEKQKIKKRWICLFTCLTTRAVHLDCVGNLTAEAFDAVLNRFVSIRGYPETILSGNATQFVAVARQRKLGWQFIAAHAP